jgi:cytochrome bd-type quinol oxidase subunit 2
MNEILLSGLLYLVFSLAFISVIWLTKAKSKLSDPLLTTLFDYLMALIVVSALFSLWILFSIYSMEAKDSYFVVTIFLFILFLLIFGCSFAAKRISNLYGFKVSDK